MRLPEKFIPEIKPIIENLTRSALSIRQKRAKGAKLRANVTWELQGKKYSKTFFKVLERQNLKN